MLGMKKKDDKDEWRRIPNAPRDPLNLIFKLVALLLFAIAVYGVWKGWHALQNWHP